MRSGNLKVAMIFTFHGGHPPITKFCIVNILHIFSKKKHLICTEMTGRIPHRPLTIVHLEYFLNTLKYQNMKS